ncbi:SulP family inorganic anion transporter [Marinicellulosiphila megalodicopiae]|uniref:SulP family inorganic anion transporter n=1 Tax=Marinicellulosiphila megalodicopiae TaxID=2724896 RepID=UPI003BB122DC
MLKQFYETSRLFHYQKKWLAGDVIAGFTIAVMLVPQAMAYAMLAGLPPIIGLYASIVPLIIYAFIGSSHQLAVGPAAMVALLISAGVSQLAAPFSSEFVSIAITLSLMVGVIQFLMGVFRLGFLTNFISHPVVSGFTSAAAVIILVSQLKSLLGINAPRTEGFLETIEVLLQNIGNVNGYALALGLLSIAILLISKKLHVLVPGALIAVLITTVLTWWFNLNEKGVEIVADIPTGLPAFTVPIFSWDQIISLLPFAITISLIGFMESYSVAQKFAIKNKYDLNPNQDLIGLGLANIVGSFFKIFPVTGGFGRTAANANAGANTQLAAIITALLIAMTLLFLTPVFYYLPKSALAAVIIVAVLSLIDIHEIHHLYKVKKSDLVLLLITILATWFLGIKEGVLIGVGVSVIWFVYKTSRPHVAVLGKLPNCKDYRNITRHKEAIEPECVLVVRMDAQLYYANATFFKMTIKQLLQKTLRHRLIKAVVIEASGINQIDSSAISVLLTLKEELEKQNIKLMLSAVKGPVKDVMQLSGFWDEGCEYLNTHKAVKNAQSNN